jgi:methylisocitrate lyase
MSVRERKNHVPEAMGLREQLDSGATVVAPGVFDPLGAKLVEHLGFKAVYMGGWVTGAHLGVTEPLLTMTEQVEAARPIASRVGIPLIVDAGAGFGEPLHALRTVQEFERAGVSAVHIEDQHHPKRAHYHVGKEDVCDRETFLQKIRLGLKGRKSDDFILIARTDAANARNGSVKEAIWRCQAALDAGADVVMPLVTPAVPELADRGPEERLMEIRAGLPADARVALLSGYLPGQEERSIEDYRSRGFQVVLFPLTPIMAYIGALESMYRPLAENGVLSPMGKIGFDVQNIPDVWRRIEELLQFSNLIKLEQETVENTDS